MEHNSAPTDDPPAGVHTPPPSPSMQHLLSTPDSLSPLASPLPPSIVRLNLTQSAWDSLTGVAHENQDDASNNGESTQDDAAVIGTADERTTSSHESSPSQSSPQNTPVTPEYASTAASQRSQSDEQPSPANEYYRNEEEEARTGSAV